MKRKLCLVIALAMLLGLLAVLPVMAAQGATDLSWASLTYTYDPDTEGGAQKSGLISFTAGNETYLERYSTITWTEATTMLYVNGELQVGGAIRLEKAGRYALAVVNGTTGERNECTVVMLPVIKADDEYVSFSSELKEFNEHSFTRYPVITCENVDQIDLDKGMSTAVNNFQSGTQITTMGRHTMKIVSRSTAFNVTFNVAVCTAQKMYDEALGVHCLAITVGEFNGEVSALLDGTTPLAPGVHKITAPGQHRVTAMCNGENVVALNAFPTVDALNLQVELLLPTGKELEEPVTFLFSRWDATFYVDGELIEGDYRLTDAGEHVFVAKDKDGNVIENVFLLRMAAEDVGTTYTELTLNFNNPHHLYVIFLIIPAVLMIAAAVFFFLQRRRIV